MGAYDHKDYTQAVTLLQKCLEKEPSSNYKDKIELYLGLSYLESNKTTKAIAQFQDLASRENTQAFTVDWYLALAYLKVEQIEKAKTILSKLKNGETNPYQEKAKALLLKLS